jgi:hypothetical protein
MVGPVFSMILLTAFSSEVGTGSRKENASNKKTCAE